MGDLGGSIEATGGSGESSYGLITSTFTQINGTIRATGGSGKFAYGVHVSNAFTQEGGSIEAIGGSNNAVGLSAITFTQKEGNITAIGSSVSGIAGIATSTFTQTDGIIEAIGGTADESSGLSAGTFTQKGGYIKAIGGSGKFSSGLVSTSFIQTDGTIKAIGGTGVGAVGLSLIGSSFTQEGGRIKAIGGTGGNAYGLSTTSFTQIDGKIKATGNSKSNAVGFYVADSFTQEGGKIKATGGSGEHAMGIQIGNSATFADTLIIARESSAASVYIQTKGTEDKVIFKSTSTLIPVIDLSKDENESGLVFSKRKIEIESGATLKPLFKNTLNSDDKIAKVLFMYSEEGIDGAFIISNSSLTMNYSLMIKDEKEYFLVFTRYKAPSQALEDAQNLGADVRNNDIALAKLIYDFVLADNFDHKLVSVLDSIDNSLEIDEVLDILRKVNPSNKLDYLIWQDIAQKNMIDSQMNLISLMQLLDSDSIGISISPKVEFGSYENVKILGYGGSLEGTYKINNLSFGLELKVLPFNTTSDFVKTKGTYISAMIAGGYSFDLGKIAPQAILSVGYSYNGVTSEREDYFHDLYNASTKQNIINAGLILNNKFVLSESLSLLVDLGVNYSCIMISDYTEDNNDNMWLTVKGDTIHSLKPFIGVNLDYKIGKFLAAANVNLQFEGLKDIFNGAMGWHDGNQRLDFEGLTADINDSRLSFGAGIKGTYEVSELFVIKLGYFFYGHGFYISHQIDFNFGAKF